MKQRTARILTNHTGSLPQSPALQELLLAYQEDWELPHLYFAGPGKATAEYDLAATFLSTGAEGTLRR